MFIESLRWVVGATSDRKGVLLNSANGHGSRNIYCGKLLLAVVAVTLDVRDEIMTCCKRESANLLIAFSADYRMFLRCCLNCR